MKESQSEKINQKPCKHMSGQMEGDSSGLGELTPEAWRENQEGPKNIDK